MLSSIHCATANRCFPEAACCCTVSLAHKAVEGQLLTAVVPTLKPEWVVEHAVKGMLPHNKLGRKMFKKLRVYATDQQPHQAQNPELLKIA